MAIYGNRTRKRMVLRVIFTFNILSITLFSACSNNPTASENPTLSSTHLYEKNCAVCHGNDGKKGLNGASDLSLSTLNYDSLVYIITNGRKIMPPFKASLNSNEIEAIAKHVELLKQTK